MEFIRRNVNGKSGTSSTSSGGGYSNVSSTGNTVLETHTIFGLDYDGTNDVRGDLTDVDLIIANDDIITDGDLVIRGKNDEGVYTDKNLVISKDGDETNFNGGEEYFFDAPVDSPLFKGDVDADYIETTTFVSEDGLINGELDVNLLFAQFVNMENGIANDLTVDTLTVTKAAHFFSLIIDEIKSVGGLIILSPANAIIDSVKVTGTGNYKCYFRALINELKITNQFFANDLVVCQTFNVAEGTSYNVSNTFYWRKVNSTGRESIDNVDYHYIILSGTDCAEGSGIPLEGDRIVTLGNKNTKDRLNAIVISAYNSLFLDSGIKAPSIVLYSGINDYTLSTHRLNIISNGLNELIGNLKVTSGETVTDLIDDLKYDKILLDTGKAVVNTSDTMTLTLSGSILVNSDETYILELSSDTDSLLPIRTTNNAFSYTKNINRYSTQTSKPTYYTLQLKLNGVIIEKINIPVIFEAGAIFEVRDDAIESAVTSLSGDISRIELKADSVTSTVNNMKVGGVNLLEDSDFLKYDSGTIWNVHTGNANKGYGFMNLLGIHSISKPSNVTAGGYLELARLDLTYKLKPNTDYTFSFYAKGINGTSTDSGTPYKYKGRVTTYVYPDVGAVTSDNNKTFYTTSTWTRYQYTFKTKADLDTTLTYHLLFRLISDTVTASDGTQTTYYSNSYICMPKLEEGTMATAWDNSTTDIKSQITQTASSIEAKIVSEDLIKSMISLDKDTIKAEVYNEMNEATGINITDGTITLNANKTTILGNLNITDTQNGITVYETATYNGNSTLIPRINLLPKQIADISDMPLDNYTFINKSIYQTSNNTWSLDFGSEDYVCSKDDTVTLDRFYLREMRTNSSGTQNPPYSTTCKLVVKMYLVKDGTATELERKEYTLTKVDSYGSYRSNDLARFSIPGDGTYRFSISSVFSQSAVSSYPIMTANTSIRVQKASRAITYIGTDGMYCHCGANKYLYVNEKETVILHGFNGIKWNNNDVNGNKSMMVATSITGTVPNLLPVWFPFYNYTPIKVPQSNEASYIKIVNDGNSYYRYAYKVNPLSDTGIIYLEDAFMNSELQRVESWVLLPPSYFTGDDGKQYNLPKGYTILVINGGFGDNKFNAYVSADVGTSHQAVFIDGHRDKNWKINLNNETHWEKFMYVGSYYSSDCGTNQDIWMTLGDAL